MEDKPPPLLLFCERSSCTIATTISDFCVFVLMEDVKKVDFGHDDVDGQECKDGRSRTWMILLYEDDPTHKAVLDGKLNDLDWNFAGRVHDQDDGVKPHHHIVVLFKDGRKNADVASDLGIDKRWLRAWDRQKKALRYLCHRDNPEKFQYATDGIYGTIAEKAVVACSKGNELSEVASMQDIIALLNEQKRYLTYSACLSLMCEKGLFSVFRRLGIIAVRLLDEHNNQYMNRVYEQDAFRASMERNKNMSWDEKCDSLARHPELLTPIEPCPIQQSFYDGK